MENLGTSLPTPESSVRIRMENPDDYAERAAIRAVNEAAFAGAEEADLVDRVRSDGHALISLVAESGGGIVGHVLFSRMWIQTSKGLVNAVALAPVAVLPAHQRKGVGSLLIRHGLELLRSLDESSVIVVGHPGYYPRFGFSTDRAAPLNGPFPREAFLALELRAGALDGIAGAVMYPPAFGL